MEIHALMRKFKEIYGNNNEDISVFFAPGRVNLIGEHTDYNGGYVLPCTLDYGTYLVIRKTREKYISLTSTEFDYATKIPTEKITQKHEGEWVNYPLGVINQLWQQENKPHNGLECMYSGSIPPGVGLSSSASVEMVTAVALNEMYMLEHSVLDLIKMSQNAENEFVGMNCGIMDQFAVGMGKANHAVFLDTETLNYELVPVHLDGYKLIITNTNKTRKLTDSKYNERRRECEQALQYLNQNGKKYKNLGKIDYAEYVEIKDRIPNPVLRKRAHHVVSEDKRVLAATNALKSGDVVSFGRLMNESHNSLRYDYEVTGFELDTLVEEALKIEGVMGSRMTGAGFGGCTISLVKSDRIEKFTTQVSENYEKKTGLKPEFYVTNIKDGARKIDL